MSNGNSMRVLTWKVSVDAADGTKKIISFTRATKDAADTQRRLNQVVGASNAVWTETKLNQKEAEKELRRQVTASNRVSKQTEKLTDYYTRMNTELAKADPNLEVVNAQMKAGVSATSAQGKEIERLVTEYQRLRNQGDAAGTSMRNMRGITQNLGWQMQDTVVQLQMGTSAFTVLSQQGSQMASAFGPGGAVLGAVIALGGAVGGTLYAALTNAVDATEELEEAQKILNEVVTTGSGTVEGFTDSLIKLATVDSGLAQLKLSTGIYETEKAIKMAAVQLDELLADVELIGGADYSRGADQSIGKQVESYKALQKQLGINEEQAKRLNDAQKEFTKSGDIEPLRDALVSLNETYGGTNEKLNENLGGITDNVIKAKEYIEALERQREAQENLNLVDEESNDKSKKKKDIVSELVREYQNQLSALSETARETAKYEAMSQLTTDVELKQADAIITSIDAFYDKKDAIEAAKAADEAAAKAAKAAAKEAARQAREADEAAAKAAKAAAKEAARQAREAAKEAARQAREAAKEAARQAREAAKVAKAEAKVRMGLSRDYERFQKDLLKISDEILDDRENHTEIMNEYVTHETNMAELEAKKQLAVKRGYFSDVVAINDLIEKERERHGDALNNTGRSGMGGIKAFADYAKAREDAEKYHSENLSKLRAEAQRKSGDEQREIYSAMERAQLNHELAMVQSYSNQLSGVVSVSSQALGLMSQTVDMLSSEGIASMKERMDEMNDAQRAMFILTQTVAAASALVNGMDLGMKMAAMFGNPALVGVGTALGATTAGVIMGTTIAGAFDDGGTIPQGQLGIVAEYGDELVDGMLVKGKAGGTRVTSREDTAKMLNQDGEGGGGMTIVQNITVRGNGDKALQQAMKQAAKQGANEGYARVQHDFRTGRGTRKTLMKSTGI